MTYTFKVNAGDVKDLESALKSKLEALRRPVQARMTKVFYGAVMANFGPVGFDRPWKWQPLSNRSEVGRAYITKVGRDYATLHLTGALQASIRKDASGNVGLVSMGNEVPYALEHHYGAPQRYLPSRRVFPLDDRGYVTPKTVTLVQEAALDAAKGAL